MSHPCPNTDDLPILLELEVDDPTRKDAESCPRCAAILEAHEAFIRAEPQPGSNPDEAMRKLSFALREALTPTAPMPAASEDADEGFTPSFNPLRWLMRPRFAMATAAVAVVLAATVWFSSGRDVVPIERSVKPSGTVNIESAALDEGGSLIVRWTAHPRANEYQVAIYDASLETIAALEPISGTELEITPDYLPPLSAGLIYVRVRVLRDGDVIDISPPRAVELR